jgi:hypothetical protein
MMKLSRGFGAAIVGSALFASAASAQLVVCPGNQTLTLGAETGEFVFEMTGAANNAAGFGFVINYDPATAPYEPVASEDGTVTCTVEEDLGGFSPLVFFFPDRDPGQFRVALSDPSFPLAAVPRDGVYMRCPVRLLEGATAGETPLTCSTAPGATSATDTSSMPIDVTCEDGTLTISAATATPSQTSTPEATDTPAATNTPAVTATNTRRVGGGGEDDDGCQMTAPTDTTTGWLLLLPAAMLIWRRRRAL